MALFSKDQERDRYYLLPGMGRRAARRKYTTMLLWAVSVGLLVSAGLAALLFLLSVGGPK